MTDKRLAPVILKECATCKHYNNKREWCEENFWHAEERETCEDYKICDEFNRERKHILIPSRMAKKFNREEIEEAKEKTK